MTTSSTLIVSGCMTTSSILIVNNKTRGAKGLIERRKGSMAWIQGKTIGLGGDMTWSVRQVRVVESHLPRQCRNAVLPQVHPRMPPTHLFTTAHAENGMRAQRLFENMFLKLP